MSSYFHRYSSDSSSSDNEPASSVPTTSSHTVLVTNLPFNLSKEDIIDHFSTRSGEIANICLCRRAKTGNHSGKCLIEFKNQQSVDNCIKLDGQSLLGQPIYVRLSPCDSLSANGQKISNPSTRFVRIHHRSRDDTTEGFDKVNGRFNGGFLLSEDFQNGRKHFNQPIITPVIPESAPAFPCQFSASLFQAHTS